LVGLLTGAAGAEGAEMQMVVYYQFMTPSDFYLFPVTFSLPRSPTPARQAVELLLAEPPFAFLDPPLPSGVRLLRVWIEDGVAYADFSEEILGANVGSRGEEVLVGAIVNTLCQFVTVDKVQIMVEGRKVESIAGHMGVFHPQEPISGLLFRGYPDAREHWAAGSILALTLRRVLDGYPDGQFRPDGSVTRAEWVKMLVEARGLEPEPPDAQQFADLPPDHWASGYVNVAIRARILVPSDYGHCLGPSAGVSRREAAMLLVRAFGMEERARQLHGAQLPFSDCASLPAWARGFIAAALEADLIRGYPDGSFRPQRVLTRAEAATLLARALKMGGPDIYVVWPQPGDVLSGSVRVCGAARVFEGTVSLRLTADDQVLARGFTTSTEGGPSWGCFAAVLPYPDEVAGPAVLECYWPSPVDGSEQGMVRVPVTLKTSR